MNLYFCKDLRAQLIESRNRPCYYKGVRYTLNIRNACLARQAIQKSLETLTVFKYYYKQCKYEDPLTPVIADVNNCIPEIYLGAWLTMDSFCWKRDLKVDIRLEPHYGLVLKYPSPVLNSAAYFLGHLPYEFSYEEERKHYNDSYNYVLNSMFGSLLEDKSQLEEVLRNEFTEGDDF